ncbi:MAG: two-component sensor histidine kinase [Actinomycetia bacterium]|nr:two-component sensor histidine kinase [Actinomycetes bacterium]
MSRAKRLWDQVVPTAVADATLADDVGPRTGRDWAVDVVGFVVAVAFGALTVSMARHDVANPLTGTDLVVDVACGSLCCASLWWRRRWPVAVALVCVLLGAFSTSATIPGLLALSSLAVHRSVRPVVLTASLWLPSAVVYAAYSRRTDTWSVLLLMTAMVVASIAWGMFVRARRQLLVTLRERARRAEADQVLHVDGARLAERARIAREMHDVLAHRISLVALHAGALEVMPDPSPEQVRESAELLRSTAHQALEELRGVIGVLRHDPGEGPTPTAPQPTLADIPRLVEETRRAGARIELEMRVDQAEAAPGALGRDAYRIVQEALTNVGKHAGGTQARVCVTGAPDRGLRVTVRNRLPIRVPAGPGLPGAGSSLPGAGAGLLGLRERVTLAGGVLVHGPDGAGDFVVEADLRW